MASTTGFVHRLYVTPGPTTCAWVGASAAASELLTIVTATTDTSADSEQKQNMTDLLMAAMASGLQVEVGHPDDSAAIQTVGLPVRDTSAQPVQLEALEITQAVQDLSHSVPLIAGKRTVARAYLSCYGSTPMTVSGRLTVSAGPDDPGLVMQSVNTVTLVPADAGNVTAVRNDANRSLNFVLPAGATAEGTCAVTLSDLTDISTGTPVALGHPIRPVVTFQAAPPLRVRIVRITYAQGTPSVTYAPTQLDVSLLVSWLNRAYPVAQVVSGQTTVAAVAAAPFGCGDINAQLAAIRAIDVNSGTDHRTHYYGLVSDGGFFMRGCAAGIPGNPDPSVVASGPTGPATWGWDNDGSYGDWYGGHELGHTFGRLHPGFCGETQDDLTRYPFPAGQLSTTDDGFGGFDVGDPALNLPLTAFPGGQWHDVMTYCNQQWLSVYTYEGIRQRLMAEDALAAGPVPAVRPATAVPRQPVPAMAGGGRPDERFRHLGQSVMGDAAGATPTEPTPISVVAQVNLTRGTGKISFVNPVPNLVPHESADGERVVLRVSDAQGNTLAEHAAPVRLNSELGSHDDRRGIVDTVLVAPPGTTRVDLLVDGTVVDTFAASGPPPALRGVRAASREGQQVTLAAEPAQPSPDGHTYIVQVSSDLGQTWETVGVGLKAPTVTLDQGQFPPGRPVQVRVTATNGFTSSVVTTETVVP